jgi:gentisate 1,2-dioxygenase
MIQGHLTLDAPIRREQGYIVSRLSASVGLPINLACITIPAGKQTKSDSHADTELWIIALGTGAVTIGEQTFEVNARDIVLIPSMQPHILVAITDLVMHSIWWDTPAMKA